MDNNVTVFKNEEFGEIRTIVIDGEPWFVGKDICGIFGDANHKRSIKRVDDEDKRIASISDRMGRHQDTYIVNESGLYSLLFGMRPQKANKGGDSDASLKRLNERIAKLRRFKHWVTSEVLPSIRKYGAYMKEEIIDLTLKNPDYLVLLANQLKAEHDARKAAEQTISKQKPLVDFANQVTETEDLIDMKTMAKLLKDDNINIGRNRLFDFLRVKGILMDDNQPYQQYVDAGYFKVKEHTYTLPSGKTKINSQTFVTGKGQVYIAKKVKEFFCN